MDLFKGERDMCTYWERAVKEFFEKQKRESNKRAVSKN